MKEGIFSRLKIWLRANRMVCIIFLVGLIGFAASMMAADKAEYEIKPMTRLLSYVSCFLIFLAMYIYCVKRKKVILSNLILVWELLVLVEIVCFFLLDMPPAFKKSFELPDLPADHVAKNIGTVSYSDSVYRLTKLNGSDTVYDIHATFDHNNKRFTPDHDSLKKDFALFFGCSIGFGEGLEDNQTLPYYFQQQSPNYNAYNFALSGHGTNNVLARLQYQNISDQVAEKNGKGFYIFFWDHIYRAIGSMSRYTAWMHNEPYYTFEDGKLVRRKMFKDGRKNISRIYELIYQTNIVKYFEMDFPVRLNDKHFDLVTEMMLEAKKRYKQQFGNDDFYVVIYPAYKAYTDEEYSKFKSFLRKKKIDFIDLSDFIEYSPKYTLNGDAHPNAATNELLAKELQNRIDKKKFN